MGSMCCKGSSLNAPGTEYPFSHSILKLDESPFPIISPLLWGNKNWPPSMKMKSLKIFWSKIGSMGCKGSNLNAPGTENPLSHLILKLDESPFPIISPLLWGNKNWPPRMKMKKLKIFWIKIGSMGSKGSSLNAPSTEYPLY